MTFEQFLTNSAQQGHINAVFEQGMFYLTEDLGRLLELFKSANVAFEVIGGVAVNVHLMAALKRSRSFVTRDIDLLVNRADLPAIVKAASEAGYSAKRMMGGYALLQPGQELSEAAHILFVGEKPKSAYPVNNPNLEPQFFEFFGMSVPVAPVRDLLILKLNSLRPKDVVHLEVLDEVGFITPELEQQLPPALKGRLREARAQFEKFE